jgi:polyphosphate kinase 2 (PPK2 family)
MASKPGNPPPRLADAKPDPITFASEADYLSTLRDRQRRMLHLQLAYYRDQRRALIVVEGWDAAGKGGAIRRLTAELDPRGYRVYPIGPPAPAEKAHHYLHRFWRRLPEPGTIAIFDRSWYGRVLVERVEKLTPTERWRRAYDEINAFERMLTDDGIRLIKFFLHISAREQKKRFRDRLHNPYKRWKLTLADLANFENRKAYAKACDEMFQRTSTPSAPWHLISAEDKWTTRLRVIDQVIARLSDDVSTDVGPVDPAVAAAARQILDR